ncbi:MAG: branched-chain amino acid ABC transporter substrate-binding protein [Coriobacteriia bacterium]|nr:branched-chain amino acid ABC transporter substrate-binding protein [Coriobacteriia bacterium]
MGMRKIRTYVSLIAVLAAVALVVTGCGGTTGTTDGGAKAVTVTIGIGAPISDGAVALGKGMVRGANLAVKQANESAEIKDLGIVLQTVEGDDKGDPTTGGNVATQFTSNPSLVGVMGHLNSGVTRVAVKIYNQGNVLQVSPANTAVDLTQMGMKNYFRVCTIDSVQGPAAADYAFKVAGKKVAFVVDDSTPYGTGLADEWAKQFEANGGKVAGREKTGDKDTDFKALVTAIKSKGVDIVYYGGIYNSGALLSKQMKEGGLAVPLMGGDGIFDGEFIKLAGAANAAGDLCTSIGLPTAEMPKGQEFIAAFKAEYPGEEIAAYDAYSYDAANVIIKAIIAVAKEMGADKVTTTEGKKAIIAAVPSTDFEGVSGKVSFDANGDTTNKAITVYAVGADGTWAPAAK